jgi:tight adherence protein C
MTLLAWAIVWGIVLGVGLWTLVSMVPRFSRPRLMNRVAPYLVDVSDGARELVARRSVAPLPVFGALFAPAFSQARDVLASALGGARTIELRLRQAGSPMTVQGFRSQQLVWGICGTGAGVLLSLALGGVRTVPLFLHALVVLVAGVAGILACDYRLQRTAARRMRQVSNELPTVLEFLTLSLSAGEGIVDAVKRVSAISRGELAGELAAVVARVQTGLPFAESLTAMASGLRLSSLSRCTEQIVGALEHGSPLAEVLRAQAQDAREDAKRRLLEIAGKKEVAMMVPLVFLILPITIIFAIFPGVFVLQFGL